MSNSLDPDQARHFVGPDLGPNCLQGNQQTTEVYLTGKELNTKELVDITFWLKLVSFDSNFFHLAKSVG